MLIFCICQYIFYYLFFQSRGNQFEYTIIILGYNHFEYTNSGFPKIGISEFYKFFQIYFLNIPSEQIIRFRVLSELVFLEILCCVFFIVFFLILFLRLYSYLPDFQNKLSAPRKIIAFCLWGVYPVVTKQAKFI